MTKKLLQRKYNGKPISNTEWKNRQAHKLCMIDLINYAFCLKLDFAPSAIFIEQNTKDYTTEDEEEYYEYLRCESGDPVFN